ncbi:TonB-dependent receptor [Fusobacterium varium]|uniref:TonB-dependent receptor n=1 Tax=Fusobacterium varium TaxID=856 RepID=UPI000E40BB0A|nr:TonB-dependent receptor [Fusobacterium varium]MCI6033366.1 TonB-dependent receptor [Fusobacterium varium]RGJ30162.1 TonB-dependent receptor [Fusobacterium varium]
MYKKIGILALILSSAVYAEEIQSTKLNESVISTENFETSVRNTAANITIVTAQEIEEKGAQDLADALRMVPGIMAKNYYGNITFDIGGYSSVHAERNTIITYDGVRISSAEASNIPISSIERIEVIPNGGGILYGDGASGGVINILSKNIFGKDNNKKISGNIRTEYGSENSYKYGVSSSVKATDRLTLKVDYSRYKINSWRDDDDIGRLTSRTKEISIDAKYKFDNADLKVKYTRNEKYRADGGDLNESDYNEDRDQIHYSPTSKGRFGTRTYTKSDDWYINYRQNIGENTEFLTYANLYTKDTTNKRTKLKTGDYEKKYLKIQIKHKYMNENYFIAGIDYLQETDKALSKGKYTGKKSVKDDYGMFIMNELKFGKLTFGQGFRYNIAKYDYYWSTYNPIPADKKGEAGDQEYKNYAATLELKYDYSDTGMVYGKLSRDFRTPLIREMNYTVNASKLDSQTQHTFELGIKDFIGDTYFSLSTFYKKTDGEIYYQGTIDSDDPNETNFPYYNMGDTRRIGVELLSEQYFGKFTFTESVTYINHKIVDSDFKSRKNKEIPMVPNWKLGFAVNYKYNDNLNLNADVVYYGNYYDSDDPENVRPKDCGDYSTVDVSANYKFENGVALTARINNLFDKHYEDYVGYYRNNTRQYSPAAGRNYSVGINYTF